MYNATKEREKKKTKKVGGGKKYFITFSLCHINVDLFNLNLYYIHDLFIIYYMTCIHVLVEMFDA
jgi:hypothetical protein